MVKVTSDEVESNDSITLALDLAKVVGVVRSDSSPCFSERVFELLFHCDSMNMEKLRLVFPVYVDMVRRYRDEDGCIVSPWHREAGGYRRTRDGWRFERPWKEENDEIGDEGLLEIVKEVIEERKKLEKD